MMEKSNSTGHEEFMWAMRAQASDAEAWRDRKPSVDSLSTTKIRRMRVKNLEEANTKIMASLVPDEIIYDCNNYEPRDYDACLLIGDVSGFAELCERHNKTKGGPSRLTQVLNEYIGTMIQEIMSYWGDVLKFSGDAFLAMWKNGCRNMSMQDCVHQALDCALVIQKTHGKYETDVGVFLRVKLAISAGEIVFSIIGQPKIAYYVCIGQPIWDVKVAENCANPGETIVSHTAWNYINPSEYVFQQIDDGVHIKVFELSSTWRSTQRSNIVREDVSSITSIAEFQEIDMLSGNDVVYLRPSVNDAIRLGIKESLRKFIVKPIMRGVDLEEPLEYLTELRQIVVLFMNVVTNKIEVHDYIRTVDTCYKEVCNIVESLQGCVNKVTLFDKDLLFVIIFGFRGFKHDLESQRGLTCAMECFKTLKTIDNVKLVSVAVTTGISYCGIVGHALRKEYTVISMAVNKAARLMVEYPNKVICDRETFLHSKLEPRNFIVQDFIQLKGIKNAGPVYEYCTIEAPLLTENIALKRPILDRADELSSYATILDHVIEVYEQNYLHRTGETHSFKYNTLMILGDARQGKTRIAEEIVFTNKPDIPIYIYYLNSAYQKIPYQTIRTIFSVPLGLNGEPSVRDTEAKLISRLRRLDISELYCVLNGIFRVNFETSALYKSFNQPQKDSAMRKMIKQLCYASFTTPWVIIIDDGQYIDDESWILLKAMMDTWLVVFLITISNQIPLSDIAKHHIYHSRTAKIMKLNPIDKWFHAGLACQFLNVYGIPPELEKVLHQKSNGNPGWIESYLTSLVQGQGLFLCKVPICGIAQHGLVVPPREMTERLYEQRQTFSIVSCERNSKSNLHGYTAPTLRKWKMYKNSFKESVTSVPESAHVLGDNESQGNASTDVLICEIAPGENVDDVDPELSLDVLTMKTFDDLTSYEQLLLKSSAIIGESFSRDMLLYIMNSRNERMTALAVQRLFEIRVLACAQGDFTNGAYNVTNSTPTTKHRKGTIDYSLKCHCKGLKIDEACTDLPKYASCGFLRFTLTSFRDTTHNLLTENQKKEFHARAVRYLEKETRKCQSCGNGLFVKVLGIRYDDGLRRRKLGSKLNKKASESSKEFGFSTRSMGDIDSKSNSSSYVHKNKKSTLFSSGDYQRGSSELVNKWMDACMEYGYLCIVSHNVPQALKILTSALESLEVNKIILHRTIETWKMPFIKAKILTLIGQSRLELGQLQEAHQSFELALKYYGYKFPSKKSIIAKLRNFKQVVNLFCFSRNGTKEGYAAEFCDELSDCLSLMCRLFLDLGLYDNAQTAAIWSLNMALESEKDFRTICTAYAHMIFLVQICRRRRHLSVALEVHALRICNRYRSQIEVSHLKAVSMLYSAIFKARMRRSESERAIDVGYVLVRICNTIHDHNHMLMTMPLLIQVLVLQNRIMEAVSVLLDLEFSSGEDIDNSAKTWYYALSTIVHIETGYTVTEFKQCERFYMLEGEHMIAPRDPDSERSFYTVMWLWCIRNELFEGAELWYDKVKKLNTLRRQVKLVNIFTLLYYLEGCILLAINRMDKKDAIAICEAYAEIDLIIKFLDKSIKIGKVAKARLLHLKAFYRLCVRNDDEAYVLLQKAGKVAAENGNSHEEGYIKHSEMAWKQNMSAVDINFWRDHCEVGNTLDYHEIEYNEGKIGYYTLLPPLYV